MNAVADIGGYLIQRSFLRALRGELPEAARADGRRLCAAIVADAHRLRGEHAALAPDAAGRTHVRVAALVLASFRELKTHVPESDARVELLKRALVEAYRRRLRFPFRVALGLMRDRFRFLTRTLASPGVERRLFGAGFAFDRREAPGRFDLVINRCLYHRFFAANGAPELTPIICHSDHAWIDEIDPDTHGVRFDRPTTIGWGGDACVFRFERTDGSDVR